MTVLLDIILPVFGLVAFGYAATYTRIFDAEAARGLAAFVFWFALPVMLFRNAVATPLPDAAAVTYLAAYYLTMGVVLALGMLLAGPAGVAALDARTIVGFGCAFSNTVLLGIPLTLTALGDEAGLPLFLIIAFHGPIFYTLVTIVMELARGTGGNLAGLPLRTLKSLLGNAIFTSVVAGLLFGLAGLALPKAIDRWAELVGRAAVPCALFSMGASLRGYRVAGALRPALLTVAIKLVLHPLLVAGIVFGLLDAPGLWARTAVLLAALPVGVNAFLFATRYRVGEAESATAILLSTVLAVPSVALVLHLLGIGAR